MLMCGRGSCLQGRGKAMGVRCCSVQPGVLRWAVEERWAHAADTKYSFTWQQPSQLRDGAEKNSVITAIPNMLTLALLF